MAADLSAIADRVLEFTNASGAAIALTSNKSGEIECCARSGTTAPEIGTSVLAENSLTALCIRSGKQLLCDNVESDPRVRGAAALDLGVRSLVITPICHENRVRGALAVLANVPQGFSTAHLQQLHVATQEIAGILWEDVKPQEKSLDRPRLLPPSGRAVARADAETKSDREQQPPEPPVQTLSSTSAAALDRFPTFERVAQAQKTLLPKKVLLAVAVAFLMVAIAIWATLTPRKSTPHAAEKIEPHQPVAAPAPEIEATIPAISSEIPSNQAALKIEPSAPAPHQGISFALSVVLSHGRDISAVPMQINYDPKVLRFVDLSVGAFFSHNGQKAILLHRDDPSSGTLKINAQLPPGASPISGGGIVCRLVFVALEKGSGAISVAAKARNSHDELINVLGSRVAVTVN